MSYIAVLGAGSWGTTLAKMLAEKEYDVSLWVYEEEVLREIQKTRVNGVYLPEAVLPDNVRASSDMAEVLNGSRYVLSVAPTQHTRNVMKAALRHLNGEAHIVSASKGIEMETHLTVSEIIREVTGRRASALSGPSFAKEVVRRKPTAVTLASEEAPVGLLLQEIFTTEYFRVYTHDDVLGVELGGALKNIMAIAAGISDGLGLGHNARAALITRGLQEMKRLGVAMGAKEKTFTGLSGLGDLVLTCTGEISRNYGFGKNLASGAGKDEILSGTKSVVEGVHTAGAAFKLSQRHGVEMPIVGEINGVLYEGKSPEEAVRRLMARTLKTEFDG